MIVVPEIFQYTLMSDGLRYTAVSNLNPKDMVHSAEKYPIEVRDATNKSIELLNWVVNTDTGKVKILARERLTDFIRLKENIRKEIVYISRS
jgi:hypothetical protein